MNTGTICTRTTHLADPEESVQLAAERMRTENVGTLIAVGPDRKPIGILTDRDLATRIVASAADARTTTVREVMSAYPRTIGEDTPIEDALETMRGLAVRRLPVVDAQGRVVGVVSIDDVLGLVADEMGNLSRIAGCSRPGVRVPEVIRPARRASAPASGLERASTDLQC